MNVCTKRKNSPNILLINLFVFCLVIVCPGCSENPSDQQAHLFPSEDVMIKFQVDWQKKLYKKRIKQFKENPAGFDKIIMLGNKTNGSSNLDFTKNESPAQMMDQVQKSGAQLQLYSGQKAYQPNREQELFKMMESGALISKDGAMYHTLEGLKA